jgi:hypothetical protein
LVKEGRQIISEDIVKALSYQLLKEPSLEVKVAIASSIGQIGKPDAEYRCCIDSLVK